MFSLIIAIVAIALVIAVTVIGGYYGGNVFSEASSRADAVRLKNEEQAVLSALDLYRADHFAWPASLQVLVDQGYLIAIPRGVQASLSEGMNLVSPAYAATEPGWQLLAPNVPVVVSRHAVAKDVCSQFNQVSRGDDGILRDAFSVLPSQCFGTSASYQVVFYRPSYGVNLAGLLGGVVHDGDLPSKNDGGAFWDTAPSGDVKLPVDPEKTPVAKLSVGSTSLTFGTIAVGLQGTAPALAITNSGNAALQGLSISAPAGFTVSANSCGAVLAPRAGCSVVLTAAPTAAGPFSGQLDISSGNGGSRSVTLSGDAYVRVPRLALSAPSWAAGLVATGKSAVSPAFTLSNSGEAAALGVSVSPPAGITLASNSCGVELPAGASCAFTLRFAPTQAQEVSASAVVAGTNFTALSAAVTASGYVQSATLPASLTFTPVVVPATQQRAVTLANTSTGPLEVTPPTAANVTGEGFSLVSTTCGTTLEPGANCSVVVQFSSTKAGSATGSLTVKTGAGDKVSALSASATVGLVSFNGAMRYSDSTYAANCKAYLDGKTGYAKGTSSGAYWISAGQQAYCDQVTDGGGWTMVRRTYGASWGPFTDNLAGTQAYGTYVANPSAASTFSMTYSGLGYSELRIATGDGVKWLVAPRSSFTIVTESCGTGIPVSRSHVNPSPYNVAWCARSFQPEDPWVSVYDHASFGLNAATDNDTHSMLYGEGSNAVWMYWLTNRNGSNVFVR